MPTATAATIVVRDIMKEDLPELVEAEEKANTVVIEDEDFGEVYFVNHWVQKEKDLLDIIKQRRKSSIGQFDTRTIVALQEQPDETGRLNDVVVGAMSWECHPDSLEVVYLMVDPRTDQSVILEEMANHIMKRADKHARRKRVTIVLRDKDEASLRLFLPFWVSKGFDMKRKRDYFDGNTDGWEMSWTSKVAVKDDDLAGAGA